MCALLLACAVQVDIWDVISSLRIRLEGGKKHAMKPVYRKRLILVTGIKDRKEMRSVNR